MQQQRNRRKKKLAKQIKRVLNVFVKVRYRKKDGKLWMTDRAVGDSQKKLERKRAEEREMLTIVMKHDFLLNFALQSNIMPIF